MADPQQIESHRQLLVEGRDPFNFFEALLEHLHISDVQVQSFGGIKDLRAFLLAFVNLPGFRHGVQSIGIVRDAESSAESAFASVRSSVENARLPVPEKPLLRSDGSPSVTVLILPDSQSPGMLETLLCRTFADSDENRCIDNFFACVTRSGFVLRRPWKARVHAYIATRSDPHVSVGVAARRGYWDLNHDALLPVQTFLRRL